MSKWMLMALAVAAMGSTGCGNRPERFEKMVQWRIDDALDELDATQAQRERVQALTKESLAQARPLAEQAHATRTALMSEWKSATPDASKVHQLVDTQLDAVRSFAHALTDKALELHQLLTPKQRDVLTEKAERFEKRAKH
ncbi:MAG: Spy/CpxP family protein refolding chaperone [Archangium sp.]|nr:Spy/CpxP family protein refolding chaperone [Archangium sp.]